MKNFSVAFVFAAVASVSAQSEKPAIYVVPSGDGFESYITAAIVKKAVPAMVVDSPERATLTLKTARIQEKKDSTSTKVMKCVFGGCDDIEDKASTSVQLVNGEGTIVWSYSVEKEAGSKNRQSMAEAIAKHLKSDYFKPASTERQ